MKILRISASFIFISVALIVTGCYVEDPGAVQNGTQSYEVSSFNRLDIGSGFDIKVQQGSLFEVVARGDIRNIRDLRVRELSGVLVIDYDHYANRKHQTYITITMPSLRGFDFFGGTYSVVSGFDETLLDIHLSGGSYCQLNTDVEQLDLTLSGASSLQLNGSGVTIDGSLSGASLLRAFEFPLQSADVTATGASSAKVRVSNSLVATASGGSVIIYRGNPSVDAYTSGGGSVYRE